MGTKSLEEINLELSKIENKKKICHKKSFFFSLAGAGIAMTSIVVGAISFSNYKETENPRFYKINLEERSVGNPMLNYSLLGASLLGLLGGSFLWYRGLNCRISGRYDKLELELLDEKKYQEYLRDHPRREVRKRGGSQEDTRRWRRVGTNLGDTNRFAPPHLKSKV